MKIPRPVSVFSILASCLVLVASPVAAQVSLAPPGVQTPPAAKPKAKPHAVTKKPAASGADFVLVGDFIWADPRGAAAALSEVEQAIRQALSAMPATAKAGQG